MRSRVRRSSPSNDRSAPDARRPAGSASGTPAGCAKIGHSTAFPVVISFAFVHPASITVTFVTTVSEGGRDGRRVDRVVGNGLRAANYSQRRFATVRHVLIFN